MYQLHEMLARERINEISRRTERSGLRRSARLISQQIRASRRHADKWVGPLRGRPRARHN